MIGQLEDTREFSIYQQVKKSYEEIEMKQQIWYQKSHVLCPKGCGECCRNFEPDLLEIEAIFMAIWLLENQNETAKKVAQNDFPFPNNNGCPFWDEKNSFHCTIYGGRPFICRLFGGCGFKNKTGETVWKPCKFFPAEDLSRLRTPIFHRQYSKKELLDLFKTLPPVMSDFMQNAIEIDAENTKTKLLREILPQTVQKIMWLTNLESESTD